MRFGKEGRGRSRRWPVLAGAGASVRWGLRPCPNQQGWTCPRKAKEDDHTMLNPEGVRHLHRFGTAPRSEIGGCPAGSAP